MMMRVFLSEVEEVFQFDRGCVVTPGTPSHSLIEPDFRSATLWLTQRA